MTEAKLLEGVLSNTLVPHQPLVVVISSPTFPTLGLGLFSQLYQRAQRNGQKNVLVTALYPPSKFSAQTTPACIDLTATIPGYGSNGTLDDVERRILAASSEAGTSSSIFLDALDILAEDYSEHAAMRLFRTLLKVVKENKPPSRLILLIPAQSPLLSALVPPSICPTITILTPHPPALLTHLSASFLTVIDASPKFWGLVESAQQRGMAEDLAYKGEAGLEVGGTVISPVSGAGGEPSEKGGHVVQVLVRKAQGGIKGISRSFEAILPPHAAPSSTLPSGIWPVHPVSDLIPVRPVSNIPTSNNPYTAGTKAKPTTHAELDLPFNLNLTESQRRARMVVPLPYAHEGEGAGLELEFEDEDEEDEEI